MMEGEYAFHGEVVVSGANGRTSRAARRRWTTEEKRCIVELALKGGRSSRALAREHGVHANSLCQWKVLYHAGKLDAPGRAGSSPGVRATLVPVSVPPEPEGSNEGDARRRSVVELRLVSGAIVRIESHAIDASLIRALIAELRR